MSLSFLFALFFALFILPRILFISQKKRLYDDLNARKCHREIVPRLGGVVFLPSILFSLSLTMALRLIIHFPLNPLLGDRIVLELLFILAGITLLYLVGIKDDLVGVRYRKKFLGQFLAAALLPLSGLYINNLYGLLGIEAIPIWISIPLTIVFIVFITNAINLIDGIDGLAVGGCSIAFFVLGFLFFERELYIYSMLSMAALGCLFPFAWYNVLGGPRRKDKLFMGDTGSLTLGFLLSYLSIKYMMYVPEYTSFDVRSLLWPVLLLFIPSLDALRVMLVRAFHHKSLFIADRNHIHHKCLDAGMSHLQATLFLLGCNISLLLLNLFLMEYLNINLLLAIDMILFVVLIAGINQRKK